MPFVQKFMLTLFFLPFVHNTFRYISSIKYILYRMQHQLSLKIPLTRSIQSFWFIELDVTWIWCWLMIGDRFVDGVLFFVFFFFSFSIIVHRSSWLCDQCCTCKMRARPILEATCNENGHYNIYERERIIQKKMKRICMFGKKIEIIEGHIYVLIGFILALYWSNSEACLIGDFLWDRNICREFCSVDVIRNFVIAIMIIESKSIVAFIFYEINIMMVDGGDLIKIYYNRE